MSSRAGADLPLLEPGSVLFVTGPGKDSGKTSQALALHARARARGLRLAMLGSGYDGEARDELTLARRPRIPVFPGDLVASPERFLRESGMCPEIFGLLAGSTAFGPLVLARATRPGSVVLAGPEGNARLAEAVGLALQAGAELCVVDGAIDRVTMVAETPGGAFVYAFRAERATLTRDCARARRMVRLASLPLAPGPVGQPGPGPDGQSGPGGEGAAPPDSPWSYDRETRNAYLRGPLSASMLAALPEGAEALVVEDFTKIFLDEGELAALERRVGLRVRRAIPLAAIAALRRGVSRAELEAALGDQAALALLSGDAYEAGFAEAGAA